MAIPSDKTELLIAIKDSYTKLYKDLQSIPPKMALLAEMDGHAKGSQMSVCNLVAYLVGWGELVLDWNAKIEQKKEIVFPEKGYKWTELGLLAQKFYQDYEQESLSSLLALLKQTIEKIIKLIESKNNAELYNSIWYKNYSMGRMIQLNTSSPYKNARIRVRKWKKTKNEFL